jgi:predicted nucleic acid-binding Zn ribbon protein
MATYDYKCGNCEQTVTLAAPITETPKAPVCIKCQIVMVRDYNFRSYKFNGKGFYSTDK